MTPLSNISISRIFKKSTRNPNLIGTNEGITIEYKESFGWKSLSDYLKAMASFAFSWYIYYNFRAMIEARS